MILKKLIIGTIKIKIINYIRKSRNPLPEIRDMYRFFLIGNVSQGFLIHVPDFKKI